jgi:hypothetical protein
MDRDWNNYRRTAFGPRLRRARAVPHRCTRGCAGAAPRRVAAKLMRSHGHAMARASHACRVARGTPRGSRGSRRHRKQQEAEAAAAPATRAGCSPHGCSRMRVGGGPAPGPAAAAAPVGTRQPLTRIGSRSQPRAGASPLAAARRGACSAAGCVPRRARAACGARVAREATLGSCVAEALNPNCAGNPKFGFGDTGLLRGVGRPSGPRGASAAFRSSGPRRAARCEPQHAQRSGSRARKPGGCVTPASSVPRLGRGAAVARLRAHAPCTRLARAARCTRDFGFRTALGYARALVR